MSACQHVSFSAFAWTTFSISAFAWTAFSMSAFQLFSFCPVSFSVCLDGFSAFARLSDCRL